MANDILIPYVHSEANELKFALRSIEKFHPESRVVLVGDFPVWFNSDCKKYCFIYCDRNDLTKQLNVRRKITLALHALPTEIKLTDDFILWYDDLIQLQPGPILPTHCGTLKEASKKNLGVWFEANVANTMIIYPDGLYYGNHYPITINGAKFIEAMKVDWKKDYLVKSLYGNYVKVEGEFKPDCKYREGNLQEFVKDKQFLSTDQINREIIDFLNQQFPDKSKFEK